MNFYAAPLSRRDIRGLALDFRRRAGLENALRFPVAEALEMLPLLCGGLYYEIVDAVDFEDIHVHGATDITNLCIRIRVDVYDGACEGNGRDRMTVAHEMGHFLLLILCGVRLYRRLDGRAIEAYRDPEWQAKCFAGELLIPKHLVGGMSVEEVVDFCGVSREAAEYQLKKFKEEGGNTNRDWKSKTATRNHGE